MKESRPSRGRPDTVTWKVRSVTFGMRRPAGLSDKKWRKLRVASKRQHEKYMRAGYRHAQRQGQQWWAVQWVNL